MSTEQAIAKTIYNEARGEGKIGMDAVGSTIVNRKAMNRSYLGGSDYQEICKKGYLGYNGANPNPKHKDDISAWNHSQQVAKQIVQGTFKDTMNGATHFNTNPNAWKGNAKMEDKGQVGHHHFWKEK